MIGKQKVRRLEVTKGEVVCPDTGEKIDVNDCRSCEYLAQQRLSGGSSREGLEGLVICGVD